MEITGPSGDAPPPSYGTDAGYSEDYDSADSKFMEIYPKLDNTEYSNTGVNNHTNVHQRTFGNHDYYDITEQKRNRCQRKSL